ncbi:MAG: histidine phosphatase superfamily-domain-containing protein [Monoraphidium minutum]|nr:MAG: histidine phosphatase superfamily-domain-containing protein [Monoraphidium minutum]
MFDRWRKLLRSFYSDKKGTFDISKVPDIYDSAKYDAIHNGHLALAPLRELYATSRQLAACVVPHEYGLEADQKLRIGSKIAAELVAKVMMDLASMQEESTVTAAMEREMAAARGSGGGRTGRRSVEYGDDAFDSEFGKMSVEDSRMRPFGSSKPLAPPGAGGRRRGRSKPRGGGAAAAGDGPARRRSCAEDATASAAPAPAAAGANTAAAAGSQPGDDPDGGGGGGGEDDDGEEEKETLHRLCPVYASDVNSPLRHVRTRIYFTSESHIHSLVNTLRYCHMHPRWAGHGGGAAAAAGGGAAAAGQQQDGAPGAPQRTASGAFAAPVAQQPWPGRASGSGGAAGASAAATPGGASPTALDAEMAAGRAWEGGGGGGGVAPLISPEGGALLDSTDECDYLTHIVFKMFENKQVPLDSPDRFVVEVLFSNGANHDPTRVVPLANDHTLPVVPRAPLHTGMGVPLQRLAALLQPCAAPRKAAPSTYALQVALCAPLSSQASSAAPSRAMSGLTALGSAGYGSGSVLAPGGSGTGLAAGQPPGGSSGGGGGEAGGGEGGAAGGGEGGAAAAAGGSEGDAAPCPVEMLSAMSDDTASIPVGLLTTTAPQQ